MWTALDGRKIYASMVEISEVHENLLQDLLTERFGWSWTLRQDTNTKAVVNRSKAFHRNSSTRSVAGMRNRQVEKKIKEEGKQTGKESDHDARRRSTWRSGRTPARRRQSQPSRKRNATTVQETPAAKSLRIRSTRCKDVNSQDSIRCEWAGESDDIARLRSASSPTSLTAPGGISGPSGTAVIGKQSTRTP